jgi:hypothetical protein
MGNLIFEIRLQKDSFCSKYFLFPILYAFTVISLSVCRMMTLKIKLKISYKGNSLLLLNTVSL